MGGGSQSMGLLATLRYGIHGNRILRSIYLRWGYQTISLIVINSLWMFLSLTKFSALRSFSFPQQQQQRRLYYYNREYLSTFTYRTIDQSWNAEEFVIIMHLQYTTISSSRFRADFKIKCHWFVLLFNWNSVYFHVSHGFGQIFKVIFHCFILFTMEIWVISTCPLVLGRFVK